ncbi:dipeptidase [Maritimibacter dapengensis]|uniref:Membrane dipeptidase n=1 Tax=Maritimibacter dapengensis TaxID=2836868 RepID=A0ABS6SZB7_9RHOB|nr:membrane dipeptidase [Maritimibacter dapengensis]MBV7378323.1 membrane dipeptidase [Maritimibacter dapengensis]
MRIVKWLLGIIGLLVVLGLAGFFLFAPGIAERGMNVVREHDPYPVSDEAQALHDSLIIGDWHADTLLWNRDLNDRGTRGQVDFPRLVEGNVAIQVFTSVTKTPAGQNYQENSADARDNVTLLAIGQLWPIRTWNSLLERALYHAERLEKDAAQSGGTVRFVTTEAELDAVLDARANGETVIAALFGTEGGHPLEGDIANLDRLQDAGLRLMGLQHFFDNELGGSLHGTEGGGLTDFGREVVAELEARPIVLDLAHSSQQVARDVIAMTDMPVIVSHTGLHSHCEVVRNYPDDLMRDIAATGGVIGIGYWEDVTCDDSPEGIAKTVRAAIDAVGEEAVTLGSDFDGAVTTSFDTSELAALTQAMLDEGLTEAQIRKVAGENMIRVLRARLD